jgi:nucleotide-binding universal stress UspA family protein
MSIFPTKILLATDGSKDAELALITTVGLARITDSELYVVTVLPESDYVRAYYTAGRLQRIQVAQQAAQGELDRQVRRIEHLGGTVALARLKTGRVAREIVETAEELGADLVAVGSRGRGAMKQTLMGGVSYSVVRHAHCPVIVVRSKAVVFPAKIVLATDGSEQATLAAQTAAELASETGSELHLIAVAPEYPYVGEGFYEVNRAEEDADAYRELQNLLDEQARKVGETGGTVARTYPRMGAVDEEIVALAEEVGADLIVMGSRGLGGMRRALMGSVSDSVVRDAPCPVMVVRRKETRLS